MVYMSICSNILWIVSLGMFIFIFSFATYFPDSERFIILILLEKALERLIKFCCKHVP